MKKTATKKKQNDDPCREYREFVREQTRLEEALQSAEQRIGKAEAELSSARRAFADSRASALINDPEASLTPDGTPAGKSFLEAHANLEACRAAAGALKRQRTERDADLLSVSERLRAEREKYGEKASKEWLAEEFEPAVSAYKAVLRRGRALAEALDVPLSPDDPDDSLGAALLRVPDPGDWEKDKDAKRLYNDHSDLRTLAESLDGHRKSAQQRTWMREREERNRGRAPFDANGKYRAIKPFLYFDDSYAVGDLCDAQRIDLATLGKLHGARYIVVEEPKDEWEV